MVCRALMSELSHSVTGLSKWPGSSFDDAQPMFACRREFSGYETICYDERSLNCKEAHVMRASL